MAVVRVKPTVSAKGIDRADAEALAQDIAQLPDGEFSSDGLTYPDRRSANTQAAKYIRVIESMFTGVELRSRTWEPEEGQWVFGLRAKPPKTEEAIVEEPEPAPAPARAATRSSGARASARK